MGSITITNVNINAKTITYTSTINNDGMGIIFANITTYFTIVEVPALYAGTFTISYTNNYISVGDQLLVFPPRGNGQPLSDLYTVPEPPAIPSSTAVTISKALIGTNSIVYTSSYSGSFTATVRVVRGGTTYTSTQVTISSPSGTASLINSVGGAQIIINSGDVIRVYATAAYGGAAASAAHTAPTPGSTSLAISAVNLTASPTTVTATSSFIYTPVAVYLETNGILNTSATYTITSGTVTYNVAGLTAGTSIRFKATPTFGNGYVSVAFAIPAPVAVPCVCAGTMISTPVGERPVETLAAGDLILTADGRQVAIKGIYTTEIASCSGRNAPYVIQAGAFGRGLPSADLTISPGHALMASQGKWMIPCHTTDPSLRAKMSRYANGQQVVYYHVELPNYLQDTFIANGVVSEAYGLNWAKAYKGPAVYTQAANGYFTRLSSPQVAKAAKGKIDRHTASHKA